MTKILKYLSFIFTVHNVYIYQIVGLLHKFIRQNPPYIIWKFDKTL